MRCKRCGENEGRRASPKQHQASLTLLLPARIDMARGGYYTVRMSMGKRKRDRQPTMWVATTNLPTAASHPFYQRLNQLLREQGFDDFAEAQCATFYAETMAGRVCRQAFTSGCC